MRTPTLIICSRSCFMLKSKVPVGSSLRPSFTFITHFLADGKVAPPHQSPDSIDVMLHNYDFMTQNGISAPSHNQPFSYMGIPPDKMAGIPARRSSRPRS